MSPIGWATGTLSPIRGDRHPFLKISLFGYFWNFIFLNIKMKKAHLQPPPSSLSWASPSGLPHAMHMHQHSLSLCVTVLVLLTHQLRQSGHTLQQNNTTCARWRLSLIAHTVGWLVAHSFCVLLPHLSSKKIITTLFQEYFNYLQAPHYLFLIYSWSEICCSDKFDYSI